MAEEKIQLTPEQEKIVLDAFVDKTEPPSITELVRLAFPDVEDMDGRSKEGRAIKVVLATKGLKARTTAVYVGVQRIELNESQKEFINNNYPNMQPVDMARALFANPALTNLNNETRSIADYLRHVRGQSSTPAPQVDAALEEVPEQDYRSPKTTSGVLQRIDKYVFEHKIKKEHMTASHKAWLQALLAYMNTFRFVHQINIYTDQTSRDLFESSFVRYCYDKPDLTEEEVDQYIVLSHEAVNSSQIQIRIERLQVMMDEAATNSQEQGRANIAMSLVESINTLQTEYNQCVNRQNTLLNSLKQKRSDRLAALRSANASILNLIQTWKEAKSRQKLIHLADLRKEVRRKTIDELTTMEEIKARIFGANPEEILNG